MIAVLVASLVGAALFFAAGVAVMMVHRPPATVELAAPVPIVTELATPVSDPELRNRRDADLVRGENERLQRELRDALRSRSAPTTNTAGKAELARMRAAIEIAERSAQQAKSELDLERAAAVASRTELARVRGQLEQAIAPDAELAQLRSSAAASESKVEQLTRKLRDEQRSVAQLSAELDLVQTKLGDAERELAGRAATIRGLSVENEQLKGRVSDAEALRADYVRLRTSFTETAFLKNEIARLEEQVRMLRRESLGGQGRRPPRASSRLLPAGSIGASLAAALERFAEPSTRSSAVADRQGFPLASAGDDGQALAAYAALAIEAGDRAAQLLPIGRPSTIEIVDERGARVAVWTFEIDSERLVLANLSVAPVATVRVDAALADLTSILANGAQR